MPMPMPSRGPVDSLWSSAYVVAMVHLLLLLVGLALVVVVSLGLFRNWRWYNHSTGKRVGQFRAPVDAGRWLLVSFGCLWILDGILQISPGMIRMFIPMILQPAAKGQPHVLVLASSLLIGWWRVSPLAWDVGVVLVQVGIGLGMLLRSSRVQTFSLWAATLWGLGVWILGEGLGGIDRAHPSASFLTGSPGAALLYVLAALVLLFAKQDSGRGLAFDLDKLAVALRYLLTSLLIVGMIVQLLPSEHLWSSRGLSSVILSTVSAMKANHDPALLIRPVVMCAHLCARFPLAVNGILVLLFGLFAAWQYSTPRHFERVLLGALLVFMLSMWYFGQGIAFFEAMPTDPNTAAPFIILICASWFATLQTQTKSAEGFASFTSSDNVPVV